jgi:tRNA threonylcarbamoyladenosine biosynthesis protein TsaB
VIILAIDTALDACSAAVLDTRRDSPIAIGTLPLVRGHAEALMPMIARIMAASGLSFASLDRIAVTTGPGSFTGLRVGLSAARGIALAAGKPLVGITTLAALAAPLVHDNHESLIISAIDARHDQVYMQAVLGNGAMLIQPQLVPAAEAVKAARYGAPRLVGSGAALLAAHWPPTGPAPLELRADAAADITWVARLGAAADPDQARPRPFYLRAPDAKPSAPHRASTP